MFSLRGRVANDKLLVLASVAPVPETGSSARQRVTMMIDTGANHSSIAEPVLRQLGLSPIGVTNVTGFHGPASDRPIYRVTLSVELGDEHGGAGLAETALSVIGRVRDGLLREGAVDGLLGIDVLKLFRLTYDGPQREFVLACDELPRVARR